uniref:Ephrin RBD domain-containing protein n=1 Tax=Acrobeloides nanus TaxID=290746 RepID=A0A914DPN2_9BILA
MPLVSRDGYDRCELRNERLLGICATPNKPSSISLVFRDFSPLPSALEFKPGRSYYVITTSEGTYSGINNTEGGLCSTKSMRIKFDVVSDDSTRLSIDNRDLAALRGSLNVDSPE